MHKLASLPTGFTFTTLTPVVRLLASDNTLLRESPRHLRRHTATGQLCVAVRAKLLPVEAADGDFAYVRAGAKAIERAPEGTRKFEQGRYFDTLAPRVTDLATVTKPAAPAEPVKAKPARKGKAAPAAEAAPAAAPAPQGRDIGAEVDALHAKLNLLLNALMPKA